VKKYQFVIIDALHSPIQAQEKVLPAFMKKSEKKILSVNF